MTGPGSADGAGVGDAYVSSSATSRASSTPHARSGPRGPRPAAPISSTRRTSERGARARQSGESLLEDLTSSATLRWRDPGHAGLKLAGAGEAIWDGAKQGVFGAFQRSVMRLRHVNAARCRQGEIGDRGDASAAQEYTRTVPLGQRPAATPPAEETLRCRALPAQDRLPRGGRTRAGAAREGREPRAYSGAIVGRRDRREPRSSARPSRGRARAAAQLPVVPGAPPWAGDREMAAPAPEIQRPDVQIAGSPSPSGIGRCRAA